MNEVEIQRDHVGSRRIAVQRMVESVTRTEYRNIAGFRGCDRQNVRMPAVVALRIVGAASTDLGQLNHILTGFVMAVSFIR